MLTLNNVKHNNVKHVTHVSLKWNPWKCACWIYYCHLIIYFHLVSVVPEAVRKSDRQDPSVFMLMIITVSIVFGLAVIFVSVMYCWTREKENVKKAKLVKSTEHDLNQQKKSTARIPPEISLTALNSLLHGNLIHQGYRSAIRLGTFNNHTVAIKVHPPSSHGECINENKMYALLGEHTNVAKVIFWSGFSICTSSVNCLFSRKIPFYTIRFCFRNHVCIVWIYVYVNLLFILIWRVAALYIIKSNLNYINYNVERQEGVFSKFDF